MSITTSLFPKYLADFKAIVKSFTELINGKKFETPYLYKEMLSSEYSADLSWGSNTLNTSIVSADVVAMDSELPLKKRASISPASGVIPKIGIKLRKGEKDISDINVMIARGAVPAEVGKKLLDDTAKCMKGIMVRNEIMFQTALSTGILLVDDDTNTGTGIRVDFGYLAANKIDSTTPWAGSTATPITDIQSVFSQADADGKSIGVVMLSEKYFNYLKASDEGKQLNANYRGIVYTDADNLPTPSKSSMLEALKDEFGAEFKIVNSSFRIEKNGTQTSIKPWAEANLAFLPTNNVGRLVYGTLAEESNPVAGVTYEKSADGILVSKFAHNEPLEELTTAQALSIPVIDGVEDIYLLLADRTA